MNCTDRIVVGAVAVLCGAVGWLLGRALLPPALVGSGVGLVVQGVLQARADL